MTEFAADRLLLFGATGDLSRRKLLPSLCALDADGLLPERLAIIGTARSEMSDGEFRNMAREARGEAGCGVRGLFVLFGGGGFGMRVGCCVRCVLRCRPCACCPVLAPGLRFCATLTTSVPINLERGVGGNPHPTRTQVTARWHRGMFCWRS